MKQLIRLPNIFLSLVFVWLATLASAQLAEKDRIEAFLKVTGFDVSLESIALTAGGAPQMLGIPEDAFGSDWTRLTEEVFDKSLMHDMAVEILEKTLDVQDLNHAAAFYASDLGQRLVEVENRSHLEEDDTRKQEEGRALVGELVRVGSERLTTLKRMTSAIDAAGTGVQALQEIQYRFLLAASAAGVVDLRVDAEGLRALLKEQSGALRLRLEESALTGSAYTYQSFSDAEVLEYTEALEHPQMQKVYELLNAIQYEIMANRFEILASRMAELHPGQDI